MSFGDVKLGHGARARSVRRRPTTAIVKIINPRPPRNDMAQQKKPRRRSSGAMHVDFLA